MYLRDYQHSAAQYAQYENDFYPIASLMVESAELADIFIKPKLRGDDKEIRREELISEAGDVLWNLSMILRDNDIYLDEVAIRNLHKLQDRLDRNVIKGDGGER